MNAASVVSCCFYLRFCFLFVSCEDGLEGLAFGSFLAKYNSLKASCRKRFVAVMDYKALQTATNNFCQSDILGEGGFGCVYKAQLDDNQFAAVKRLDGGTQDAIREFEVHLCFSLFCSLCFWIVSVAPY